MTTNPVSVNEIDAAWVKDALEVLADVLEGGAVPGERLDFRVLLDEFDVDSDMLTPDHRAQLDALLALNGLLDDLRIDEIIGRASGTGPEGNNVSLSQGRGTAVVSYLVLGGLASSRIADVRATGSANPLLDVGPVEEPVNRSVELLVSVLIRQVPPTAATVTDWTIHFGIDVTNVVGRQAITIERKDTSARKHFSYVYLEGSASVVAFNKVAKMLRGLRPFRFVESVETAWEAGLKELPAPWMRWLSKVVVGVVFDLGVMPADAQPIPLYPLGGAQLDLDMFDRQPVIALEPFGATAPVGEAQTLVLFVIGFPVPIAYAYKWFDVSGGFASLIPDAVGGIKVGCLQTRTPGP